MKLRMKNISWCIVLYIETDASHFQIPKPLSLIMKMIIFIKLSTLKIISKRNDYMFIFERCHGYIYSYNRKFIYVSTCMTLTTKAVWSRHGEEFVTNMYLSYIICFGLHIV